MKNALLLGLVIVLAMTALLASACGSSEEDAKVALGAALDKVEANVAKFQQMGPTSTVADIKAARDALAPDWKEAIAAAKGIKEVKVADLEKAWNDVDQAINSIPDGATIIQAAGAIMAPVQALLQVEANLRTLVGTPK